MFWRRIRKTRRWWVISVALCILLYLVLWYRVPSRSKEQDPDWVNVKLSKGQTEYVDRRGVHVVVGRYIPSNEPKINLTKEMLNANRFHPDPNAGKNGRPVIIGPKDLLEMQRLYQIHRYNLMVSDRLPLNRSLPEVRRKKCKNLEIDIDTLPKTSVIIVFHNEAWSTLLRTVWSVINRSPRKVLKEIILVDDASEREYLKESLDKYVKTLPVPTRVVHTEKRNGLIQAKILGSKLAKAPVLTFLDAHCECTTGWLETLLYRLKDDRTRVVTPVIDIIHEDTFAYIKSFELYLGSINWRLNFRWFTLTGKRLEERKKDVIHPYPTPIMAGGLFAIYKDYFFEIGAYDPALKIWGGENIEMSLRVWQCGGSIEIVPCSHVGHVFRKSSPYSYPDGVGPTLSSNLARVAMVWMDEWADFFFKFSRDMFIWKSVQNVTDRLELRERLKCKNFEWFLDNIWPEHFFPKDDRFFGKIRNVATGQCMIKSADNNLKSKVVGTIHLISCMDNDMALQMFIHKPNGFITTDDSMCFDALEGHIGRDTKLRFNPVCQNQRQKWRYDNQTKEIIQVSTKRCLEPFKAGDDMIDEIMVTECKGTKSQQWILESVPWK